MRMQNTSAEYLQNSITQSNAIQIGQIVESDFYKAGFKAANNKVLAADSVSITFRGDVNADGNPDTVNYYLSAKTAANFTANPNDMILYRKLNAGTSNMVAVVTAFRLAYYDTLGAGLSYSGLTTQTNRDKIKLIQIYIKSELAEQSQNSYSPVEWQEKIRPKNL